MRVIILLMLTGCSTTPYQLERVNNQLSEQGKIGDASIGINDKNQAIVQVESTAATELKLQQWRNYDLEKEISYNRSQLSRCQTEIADPRLGGDGHVIDVPEADSARTSVTKEEFGTDDNGQLKVVKKEFYVERLKLERQRESTLGITSAAITKRLDTCERELGYVRVKHGLPSKRYQAKGHFESGQWIHERAAENSLDDAFAIQSGKGE